MVQFKLNEDVIKPKAGLTLREQEGIIESLLDYLEIRNPELYQKVGVLWDCIGKEVKKR